MDNTREPTSAGSQQHRSGVQRHHPGAARCQPECIQGGIVALLGTNGAGKTTTLRAISGLLKPENGFIRDGYIKFGGSDITNVLGTQVVKLGAIMVPEGRRVFKHLTVEENIRVGSITRKDGSQKIRRQRQDVRSLPAAFRNYPPAGRLLLRRRAADDRHCPGADGGAEDAHAGRTLFRPGTTAGQRDFRKRRTINRELGTTILVVEQNAKIALQVSDYAYIMESGKIVLEGPSKELKDNPDVKEFYMGITQGGGRKSFKEVKSYKRRKRWM
jgi:branched-chain amino acid transport system ATP-binding protein